MEGRSAKTHQTTVTQQAGTSNRQVDEHEVQLPGHSSVSSVYCLDQVDVLYKLTWLTSNSRWPTRATDAGTAARKDSQRRRIEAGEVYLYAKMQSNRGILSSFAARVMYTHMIMHRRARGLRSRTRLSEFRAHIHHHASNGRLHMCQVSRYVLTQRSSLDQRHRYGIDHPLCRALAA